MSREFTFRKEETVTLLCKVVVPDNHNEDDAREVARKEGEWTEDHRTPSNYIYYVGHKQLQDYPTAGQGEAENPPFGDSNPVVGSTPEDEDLGLDDAPARVDAAPTTPPTQEAQPEPAPVVDAPAAAEPEAEAKASDEIPL